MNHEVVRTRKGLVAMRSLDAGEVMHPGVGPLVEAEQLYVRQSRLGERLRTTRGRKLVLFDIGMGAGSNALAARAESERAPAGAAQLELVSFERDLGALKLALTQPSPTSPWKVKVERPPALCLPTEGTRQSEHAGAFTTTTFEKL
jgi:hypothetical protein